jgi:hypothetical protein
VFASVQKTRRQVMIAGFVDADPEASPFEQDQRAESER